jgi:hypothetical protein
MTNNIVPPVTSLESVVQQFEHWRATREKRDRIPDSLWSLVTPLINQYNRNQICSALKINYDQLKEHTLPSTLAHKEKQSARFVECSLPPVSDVSTGNCIIEFTCKNGSAVKISGLHSTQMQSIFSMLMGN